MVRAIDNPSPVPCCFVVTNGSKMVFSLSSGMPTAGVFYRYHRFPISANYLQFKFARSRRNVLHGINCVHRQIQEHLLNMHAVGTDSKVGGDCCYF